MALGAAAVFALLPAACQESRAKTSSPFDGPSGLSTVTVTRITDGDTVVIVRGGSEAIVRLIGVNAPERDECFFGKSTNHLIEALEGVTVEIEDLGTDQFGRTLAYLWADARLVNLELVAGGWAIATTPGEAETYGQEILDAEREAVETSAGLWAADACGPAEEIPKIDISVAPDPPGPDNDRLGDESITLVNTGAAPVDISGWALRDESSVNRYRFGERTIIEPGTSIKIPSTDPGWKPGNRPVWNNDGDLVMLLTNQGTVMAHYRYVD